MTLSKVTTMSSWPDGTERVQSVRNFDTGNSSRVNGKLRLRANYASIDKSNLVSSVWKPGSIQKPPDGRNNSLPYVSSKYTHVDNMAYNRLRGKLFKGGASLGVTFASWRQSREMITHRLNSTRRTLDSAYESLKGNKGAVQRLRREREPLANQVLETEFGWMPLLADIHASLFTVCKNGVPPEWLTGRAREVVWFDQGGKSNPYYFHTDIISGVISTSYSCKATINNPNVWLLNRLGLINPATVVWDLVPWSFVVNMFVNVNSLLNSYTDWVGLDISDHTVTRTSRLLREWSLSNKPSGTGFCSSNTNSYTKRRTVGTPLRPKLEIKIPEMNWELALIASSLVIQRFQKINRLIRVV